MATHTPKRGAARKRVASREATPSRQSGVVETSSAQASPETPNWGDHNPELRRRYIAAEKQLAAATKRSDRRRIRQAQRELDRIGREFVELNRGLIVDQARRFNRNAAGDQDNMSAATLGLWEAFLRFDPDRGVAFSTFSRMAISGALQRTVHRAEYSHLSNSEFALRKQVRLAQAELSHRLNRAPTPEEIAKGTGIDLDKVNWMLTSMTRSLDAPLRSTSSSDDGSLVTLADRLAEAADESDDDEDGLDGYLNELSELELWLILQRSGCLSVTVPTLLDAADAIGIGREVARRSEVRARARIAATAIADRTGRLATIEEVAKLTGATEQAVKDSLSPRWEDLRNRYLRLARACATAPLNDRAMLRERLDRCGEEFMLHLAPTIVDAAARYVDEQGEPIGIAEATRFVWKSFFDWDPADGMFVVSLRPAFESNYRKAQKAKASSSASPQELWSAVAPAYAGS